MVQDLKVGNTNSISMIKYSMLHTFMTPCLRNCLCLAVYLCVISSIIIISLTSFSHRISNHKTIVK